MQSNIARNVSVLRPPFRLPSDSLFRLSVVSTAHDVYHLFCLLCFADLLLSPPTFSYFLLFYSCFIVFSTSSLLHNQRTCIQYFSILPLSANGFHRPSSAPKPGTFCTTTTIKILQRFLLISSWPCLYDCGSMPKIWSIWWPVIVRAAGSLGKLYAQQCAGKLVVSILRDPGQISSYCGARGAVSLISVVGRIIAAYLQSIV